jgi:hypothetical protein
MDLAIRRQPPGILKSGTGLGELEKVVLITLGYATSPWDMPRARTAKLLRLLRLE